MSKLRRAGFYIALPVLLTCAALWAVHAWVYAVPQGPGAPGGVYAGMPADRLHQRIELPVDHSEPARGSFSSFYLLSPRFFDHPNDHATFLLTDGQMDLVGAAPDFGFFDDILGGAPYVLIAVRGHAPTVLPQVYPQGRIDYALAMKLYGSDQQVQDIEAVRADMARKGLLPADGRIHVFGASGAGVLAQQYVSRFPGRVKRLILESTGAPDLALRAGLPYSPDLPDFNPAAADLLAPWLSRHPSDRARVANVLYQQGREARDPRAAQLRTVQDLADGGGLWMHELSPRSNLALLAYVVQAPSALMARVRWFELVGTDLMRYDPATRTNLLYDLSTVAVADVLDWHRRHHIAPKAFELDRRFPGEVLILKGTDDVVFGDAVNALLRDAYPHARLLRLRDGHRLRADSAAYRALRVGFLRSGFDAIAASQQALGNILVP